MLMNFFESPRHELQYFHSTATREKSTNTFFAIERKLFRLVIKSWREQWLMSRRKMGGGSDEIFIAFCEIFSEWKSPPDSEKKSKNNFVSLTTSTRAVSSAEEFFSRTSRYSTKKSFFPWLITTFVIKYHFALLRKFDFCQLITAVECLLSSVDKGVSLITLFLLFCLV